MSCLGRFRKPKDEELMVTFKIYNVKLKEIPLIMKLLHELRSGQVTEKVRNARFVKHIENHLKELTGGLETHKVSCKICGKTIDEIAQEGE